MLSCECSKSFWGSFFYRTTPVAAFERTLKKKVSGEIAFALISLFHIQIQEPASRSATMTAFVFLAKFAEFHYHKIFQARTR